MALKPLLPLLVCVLPASPQTSGLPARETLSYSIEWRLFTAGKATMQWTAQPRDGFQLSLHVESAGFVSKLFKVEDDYSASLGPGLCVQSSQSATREGSRQRETKITFDAETRKASYLERDRVKGAVILAQEIDIPPCVHDMVGGLYFARTLNLEPGQSVQAPVSDGKKAVMAKIEAQQREEVKTPSGAYKTIRYEAYLFNNVLFRRSAHLNFWLTDDSRKLPVQIRVRLPFTIGTITLQLEKRE
ncbi:MAG: DUF3108 domain-containing protein [Acidobacteriia bacterium]|nr:DUF3108 domain-containing protein [Terriglobia bacterium]